ncbi:hypothetical protein [Streptomyces sp. NPDC047000]|uniref:hypothetical protein n=1 Tax=Streptomyces sp. NPDC047000 TaxID=3155474 RepID=UPI00340FC7DE
MTTDDRPEQHDGTPGTPGAPDSGPDRADGTSGPASGPVSAPDSPVSGGGAPAPGDRAGDPATAAGGTRPDPPTSDASRPSGPAEERGTAAGGTETTAGTPGTDAVEETAEAGAAREGDRGAVAAGEPADDEHDVVEVGAAGTGKGAGRDVRRRRPSALVAGVVAAVLVVGGGAYLGASALGGGGGAGAAGTPGVLVLDGYGGSGTGGTGAVAPGEPNPYGTAYRASGTLPGGPRSAPVYRAAGEVTRSDVARLAKALGVDGTPVTEGPEWRVGPGRDGTGPSLRVSTTAPGAWTFSRYAPGTDGCGSGTARCTPGASPSASSATPVSESAAERAAAPVLEALGQDDAAVDAGRLLGSQRVVNADPVVGDLPTDGWTTGLAIDAQGEVAAGTGRLKMPVRGETYPVLSARKTLDLMNAAPGSDHRMGIGGCASPVPLKDRLEAPCGTGTTATAATTSTAAATAVVEKAVFGLAAYTSGGRQVLVPSWLFEVREGGRRGATATVARPAVDPRYLASSASSAQPVPLPTGTGTGGAQTRDIAVEGYRADGRELTVTFTSGVCATFRTSATEESGKVTVKVTGTTRPGTVCVMIAKFYEQVVELDRPLGDRKVVGTDGKEIPRGEPGRRVPAPTASSAPSAR